MRENEPMKILNGEKESSKVKKVNSLCTPLAQIEQM